ncbi:MAG: endolytic transglycosylase MltG [Muribaculaceae bacterium]|nr:endolytic transglycosylase MltG [Muribaculaceae bacterium]
MKNKKRKCPRILFQILSVAVIICCIAGVVIYIYASKTYDGERVRIYVDAGSGDAGLRDSLVSRLGDDYGGRVHDIWRKISNDEPLKSGSYIVEPGDRAWKLAARIKNQRQNPVKVTFNNLRTFNQLIGSLDDQLLADTASLTAAIDSVLGRDGVAPADYVSHFFPDTYEFYWNEPAAGVVAKITANYDRFWNEERRAKADKLHLTPDEVATLASIVEEETNKADERPAVARLYLNRLDAGMKLQADPTVKFALGDFSLKRILNKHLQVASPYNTYMYKGLPPGPIRIPEASTLDAVLNAPSHKYLYMCAKEDFSGYHNFAVDYASHQANAKKYQAALDRNGYK